MIHMEMIKISNISSFVQGDILYTLFGFFGPIELFIIYPSSSSSSSPSPPLEVLLQYKSETEPELGMDTGSIPPSSTFASSSPHLLALQLSGLLLGDRALKVTPYSLPMNSPFLSSSSIYVGNVPQEANELSLSKYILHALTLHHHKSTSTPSTTTLSSSSGRPISYLRLGGESWLPARHAFIELESPALASTLVHLNGKLDLQGAPLYLYASYSHETPPQKAVSPLDGLNSASTLPLTKQADLSLIVRSDHPLYAGLSEEEMQLKMLRLSALSGSSLSTSLMGRHGSSGGRSNDRRSRSRSRSRSRYTSRHSSSSSRRRHRSRTRSRSRSRDRHGHTSSSRSYRRHGSSRSRSRSRSRSHRHRS